MKRYLIAFVLTTITIAFTGSAIAQQPSRSAKWTKTYVIEWNEPAMYYGAKTGVIDPGTDCPQGTNPESTGLRSWWTRGTRLKRLSGCAIPPTLRAALFTARIRWPFEERTGRTFMSIRPRRRIPVWLA